jgi:hypothetical protein
MQVWEVRVQIPAEAGIFLLFTTYMPNHPPLQRDTATLFLWVEKVGP